MRKVLLSLLVLILSMVFTACENSGGKEPKKVTITFHKNDGSGETEIQRIPLNTGGNLIPNPFTNPGLLFRGWATTSTGDIEYRNRDYFYFTKGSDTNLYAKWSPPTITFHKNDGSNKIITQVVEMNSAESITVILMPNEFKRDNHTFTGWEGNTVDSTGKYQRVYAKDEGEIQVDFDVTLYAIWDLSKEAEAQIKQDYFDIFIKDKFDGATMANVSVERYYGTFGDSIVVRMDDEYIKYDDTEKEMVWGMWVWSRLIRYSGFDRVWVWNNGKFYELGDASNPDWKYNGEIGRILNRLNGLCVEIEPLIVESWNQSYLSDYRPINYFWGWNVYHGTYNNSVVFMIDHPDPYPIFVGGQILVRGTAIYVWQEGRIYTLREAYNSGFLTKGNIKNIAYYNNLRVIDLHHIIDNNGWFPTPGGLYILCLSEGSLDELKELHESGLFTPELIKSIAIRYGLNYNLILGGK